MTVLKKPKTNINTAFVRGRLSTSLMRRTMKNYEIPYICELCKCEPYTRGEDIPNGQAGEWYFNNHKVQLQVDHRYGRNGDHLDDSKWNLRWLCGTCHAQMTSSNDYTLGQRDVKAIVEALLSCD